MNPRLPEQPADWPKPSAEAMAASQALSTILHRQIGDAGGWLSFSDWMETALYHPGLGYYSGGSTKLGPGGDFVTAPVLSPVFAETLALALSRRQMPRETILELGPGDGSLARDLLLALAERDALPEQLLLLERSASLIARQRETLDTLPTPLRKRVLWLQALPETPIRGAIIANEVADALSVKRFQVNAPGSGSTRIQELGVVSDGAGFGWKAMPSPGVAQAVEEIEACLDAPLPAGYQSEYVPALGAWVGALADCLETGCLFLIDYGYRRSAYYHPERSDGTLRCHYRHRSHGNPFFLPGLQDITASVDFSALIAAAEEAGLTFVGLETQARFLIAEGITDLLQAKMQAAGTETRLHLAQQAKRLLLPSEMGERFQVLEMIR